MEPKSIRGLLVLVVLALGVVLAVVVIKRVARKPPGVHRASGEPGDRWETLTAEEKALVRAQRAAAITAIEKSDYASALATLSSIVKTGNGLGDEVELFRVARELEEKYRNRAEKQAASKAAPAPAPASPPPP